MKKNIRARLEQLKTRLEDIERQLEQVGAVDDLEIFRKLNQERAELEPIVERYCAFLQAETDLASGQELLQDVELKTLVQEEITRTESELVRLEEELDSALLPTEPDDMRNLFLEIRAGTGGDESALFAGTLLRMYSRYVERKGWQMEIISHHESDLGGYREVIVRIMGQGAYAHLKFESGGHRVQRVPSTETQGRIHTSACTVAVLPEADAAKDIVINPAELRIDTFRASGAGGQHVNKTDSAVRITHLPSGLVVECQDDRSQHRNRAQAMSVLAARLKAARQEQEHKQLASTRKTLIGSGDRSERIRTYNFPQGRVTDHRINLTLYKMESIMGGALDELIAALRAQHKADLLAAMADND